MRDLEAAINRYATRFQSTPLVAERRCRALEDKFNSDWVVSIHAPRCREAMPASVPPTWLDFMFQSTPLVAERRCIMNNIVIFDTEIVSIHAPRCREAMPLPIAVRVKVRASFNPRPSLPRGDA